MSPRRPFLLVLLSCIAALSGLVFGGTTTSPTAPYVPTTRNVNLVCVAYGAGGAGHFECYHADPTNYATGLTGWNIINVPEVGVTMPNVTRVHVDSGNSTWVVFAFGSPNRTDCYVQDIGGALYNYSDCSGLGSGNVRVALHVPTNRACFAIALIPGGPASTSYGTRILCYDLTSQVSIGSWTIPAAIGSVSNSARDNLDLKWVGSSGTAICVARSLSDDIVVECRDISRNMTLKSFGVSVGGPVSLAVDSNGRWVSCVMAFSGIIPSGPNAGLSGDGVQVIGFDFGSSTSMIL